jgi:hypothetical protein
LDVEIVYEGDASAYFTLQVRSLPIGLRTEMKLNFFGGKIQIFGGKIQIFGAD